MTGPGRQTSGRALAQMASDTVPLPMEQHTMRRITVFEREGGWRFSSPQGEHKGTYDNALDAAIAGRDFGDTLYGHALGFVIRLQIPYEAGSDAGIVIHSKVFSG